MTLLGYGTNLCVVVSVRGEIKYRGVIVKHMLRAVAVVHVPVHDQHTAQPVLVHRSPRSDGDRVAAGNHRRG